MCNSIDLETSVYANEILLPKPGNMIALSKATNPTILKGIKVHPDNPFKFDFVLDQGANNQTKSNVTAESTKLIKYFLAALTTPEKDMWVNLSPYEKDRIVPEAFGQTEMGRDLLAQDYLLKQITASLVYPEGDTGKKFWKQVYEIAVNKNVPVNTFNKVWIVPDKALVYENAKTSTAYIVESSFKVLTEQDYLANTKNKIKDNNNAIVRDIIVPQLTKDVNEGSNFAQLRQIYNSLILAAWYKKKIKNSILTKVYADKNKTKGTEYQDNLDAKVIYQRYLQAFKKGVFNYIKDPDPANVEFGAKLPRKYFSGGISATDFAQLTLKVSTQENLVPKQSNNHLSVVSASVNTPDFGMISDVKKGVAKNRLIEIDPKKFDELFKSWPQSEADENLFKQLALSLGMYLPATGQWLEDGRITTKEQVGKAILKEIALSYLKYDSPIQIKELKEHIGLKPWLEAAERLAAQAYLMKRMYDMKVNYVMHWKAQLIDGVLELANMLLWQEPNIASVDFQKKLSEKTKVFIKEFIESRHIHQNHADLIQLFSNVFFLTDDVLIGRVLMDKNVFYFLLKRPDGTLWNEWEARPVLQGVLLEELPPSYFVWISEEEIKKNEELWKTFSGNVNHKYDLKTDDFNPTNLNDLLVTDNEIHDFQKLMRGDRFHPDIATGFLSSGQGPKEQVRLLSIIAPPQITYEKPEEKKKRKKTKVELVEEYWIALSRALYVATDKGEYRPLTQQEFADYIKKRMDAVQKEKFEADIYEQKDTEFDHVINHLIALLYEGIIDNTVEGRYRGFSEGFQAQVTAMHSISFSAIREQARRMISIAASIPKDDRLWVTSSEMMYHALTTWCDLSGLPQKVYFVPEESIRWSDYTRNIFKFAYDETYGKNSSPSVDWTIIHNDYLERLHFSYRVDAGFKKEIDRMRLALERKIPYSNHESYRFIGHNLEPLILEFVMRTGKNPHVANPFIVGEEDLINPDYVSKLSIYGRQKEDLYSFISPWADFFDIGTEKILGTNFSRLRYELYLPFMYNETLHFIKERAADKNSFNPPLSPVNTHHFTIPAQEFTRPNEEDSIAKLDYEPFLQMVKNIKDGEWLKSRALILPRYRHFLRTKQLTEQDFLNHIIGLFEQAWGNAWDRVYKKSNDDRPNADRDPEYRKALEIFQAVLEYGGPNFFSDEPMTDLVAEGFKLDPADGKYYKIKQKNFHEEEEDDADTDKKKDANKKVEFDYYKAFPHVEDPDSRWNSSLYDRDFVQFFGLIIKFFPQKFGPIFMDFFVEMMNHAEKLYERYASDWWSVYNGHFNIMNAIEPLIERMALHPDYFASLLLKSRLSPKALIFLMDPNRNVETYGDTDLPNYESLFSGSILNAMVRLHEDTENQMNLVDVILNEKPEVIDNYILKNWRTLKPTPLQRILSKLRITTQDLEKMEEIINEGKITSRAVALYLAQNPKTPIEMLEQLDPVMKDESIRYVHGWIKAIIKKQWTLDHVLELMGLPLWKNVAYHIRYEYSPVLQQMKLLDQAKMRILLKGKVLTPYKVNDLYPLNLPDDDEFRYYLQKLRFKDMSRSSYYKKPKKDDKGQEIEEVFQLYANHLESEDDLRRRIDQRSQEILRNWEYYVLQPIEELQRRIALLEKFETEQSEMENDPYILLLGVESDEFDKLHKILLDNFESLQSLDDVTGNVEEKLRNLVAMGINLANQTQEEIVGWAAKQLGLGQDDLMKKDAREVVRKAFSDKLRSRKLSATWAGQQGLTNKQSEEAMRLKMSRDLLLEIVDHIKIYKHWLSKVVDPPRLLLTYNPKPTDKAMRGGINLDSTKIDLNIHNTDGEIIFKTDLAMLKRFKNTPGFTPVILNIQPLVNLRIFLGI